MKYFVGIFICAWFVLLVLALKNNSEVKDVGMKANVLRADMQMLVSSGGVVVDSQEYVKGTGVSIARWFHMEGWSDALVSKFRDILKKQGWVEIAGLAFCKDGMLTTISANAGMAGKQAINSVVMRYNVNTVQECKR